MIVTLPKSGSCLDPEFLDKENGKRPAERAGLVFWTGFCSRADIYSETMRKITCLIAACALFAVQACSQQNDSKTGAEAALNKQVDAFTEKHRSDWNGLEETMMNMEQDSNPAVNAERFRQQAFYKSYQTFLKENNKQYVAVREARLKQYAPPPPALKSMTWHTPTWLEPENATFDIIGISFMRAWEPYAPAQLVSNIILPGLASANASTAEEINAYYRVRELFGFQLYAEPAKDGKWQIWYADHNMAVTFLLNPADYNVSDVRYTEPKDPAFAAIAWSNSLVKPVDESSRLIGEMRQTLWENYKGYDDTQYQLYQTQRDVSLNGYFNSNEAKIKSIRLAELKRAEKGQPPLTGYKEKPRPQDDLLSDVESGYGAHAFLYPQEWVSAVQSMTGAFYDEDAQHIGLRLTRNAIFKSVTYAKDLGNDQWEVYVLNDTDALAYVWDLKTGKISAPRYWLKL